MKYPSTQMIMYYLVFFLAGVILMMSYQLSIVKREVLKTQHIVHVINMNQGTFFKVATKPWGIKLTEVYLTDEDK